MFFLFSVKFHRWSMALRFCGKRQWSDEWNNSLFISTTTGLSRQKISYVTNACANLLKNRIATTTKKNINAHDVKNFPSATLRYGFTLAGTDEKENWRNYNNNEKANWNWFKPKEERFCQQTIANCVVRRAKTFHKLRGENAHTNTRIGNIEHEQMDVASNDWATATQISIIIRSFTWRWHHW